MDDNCDFEFDDPRIARDVDNEPDKAKRARKANTVYEHLTTLTNATQQDILDHLSQYGAWTHTQHYTTDSGLVIDTWRCALQRTLGCPAKMKVVIDRMSDATYYHIFKGKADHFHDTTQDSGKIPMRVKQLAQEYLLLGIPPKTTVQKCLDEGYNVSLTVSHYVGSWGWVLNLSLVAANAQSVPKAPCKAAS
jgi:hypothetical protein